MKLISIVMPYWNRQAAANRALSLISQHYSEMPLEVVMVDDGSGIRFSLPAGLDVEVRVIRLRSKGTALNPCVPINAGAADARGDVLVLSNPEILHPRPVLAQLVSELDASPDIYATAACWCPETKRWHCHSTLKRPDLFQPEGSGFHFLAAMHRSLWDKAGGFDERYRLGQAYDDADWVLRVQAAGGRFVQRDDLVVEHPWKSTKSKWGPGMLARNKELFFKTWGHLAERRSA